MSNRTTLADIELQIKRINQALGQPISAYEKDDNGKFRTIEGVYILGQAYGKCQIQRIANEGGGIHTVSGFGTKKETYYEARAILHGIEAAKGWGGGS